MGQKKNLNQFYKNQEKEKALNQPGMEVFVKLQEFYKLHPTSTPQVAMEVVRIREECEKLSKELEEKFQNEHRLLMVEYMQKELDYVESYLSPDQKEKDSLQSDVNEILKEDTIPEDLPEKKASFLSNIFSW